MPTFVQILDFIGTFAFAISGIRLASAKRFDWFGAYVVGFVTAIGGGTIRDLLLDVTPGWMTDPIYLICTGLALLWVILFGKHLIHLHNTFFIFDSIGLALFTVVGVGKSIALGYPFWVAIIMDIPEGDLCDGLCGGRNLLLDVPSSGDGVFRVSDCGRCDGVRYPHTGGEV